MISDVKITNQDMKIDSDVDEKMKLINDLAEGLGLKTLILIGLPYEDIKDAKEGLNQHDIGSVTVVRGNEKALVFALGQASIVDANFGKVIEKYGEFQKFNRAVKDDPLGMGKDLLDGIGLGKSRRRF